MEKMVEVRHGRILHIETHENPESNTTIFLIHGLGGRGDQWREQIPVLKNHFSLVIPDLLGHGKSSKPYSTLQNLYTFDEFDQDLQALFNQYSTENNILIGHSLGGALAVSLVRDHQDKINKFILVSPLPCAGNIPIPLVIRLPVFLLEFIRPLLDYQFEHLAFSPHANPELIAIEKNAARKNSMYVIKQTIKGLGRMQGIDLTMLNTPGLIISGEPDNLVPIPGQKTFYRNLPRHKFVIIPDSSHMGLLENSKAVNSAIMKFCTANML